MRKREYKTLKNAILVDRIELDNIKGRAAPYDCKIEYTKQCDLYSLGVEALSLFGYHISRNAHMKVASTVKDRTQKIVFLIQQDKVKLSKDLVAWFGNKNENSIKKLPNLPLIDASGFNNEEKDELYHLFYSSLYYLMHPDQNERNLSLATQLSLELQRTINLAKMAKLLARLVTSNDPNLSEIKKSMAALLNLSVDSLPQSSSHLLVDLLNKYSLAKAAIILAMSKWPVLISALIKNYPESFSAIKGEEKVPNLIVKNSKHLNHLKRNSETLKVLIDHCSAFLFAEKNRALGKIINYKDDTSLQVIIKNLAVLELTQQELVVTQVIKQKPDRALRYIKASEIIKQKNTISNEEAEALTTQAIQSIDFYYKAQKKLYTDKSNSNAHQAAEQSAQALISLLKDYVLRDWSKKGGDTSGYIEVEESDEKYFLPKNMHKIYLILKACDQNNPQESRSEQNHQHMIKALNAAMDCASRAIIMGRVKSVVTFGLFNRAEKTQNAYKALKNQARVAVSRKSA